MATVTAATFNEKARVPRKERHIRYEGSFKTYNFAPMKRPTVWTTRNIDHNAPSQQVLHEWEDSLCLPLHGYPRLKVQAVLNHLPPSLVSLYLGQSTPMLFIEGQALHQAPAWTNNPNIVPWIMDYYMTEAELPGFLACHDRNPLILVMSRDAYEQLHGAFPQLPLRHVAMPLPDKYLPTANATFDKRFDCAQMGRRNTAMTVWLERYAAEHPGFTYINRRIAPDHSTDGKNHLMYYSNTGEEFGQLLDREAFLGLMRQARVGLYAAPGLDGDEVRTKNNHQVTVRPLEYLSQGCRMVGKWVPNADTAWWQLDTVCPNVQTYDEFAQTLERELSTPFDLPFVREYIAKHLTSVRLRQIRDLMGF